MWMENALQWKRFIENGGSYAENGVFKFFIRISESEETIGWEHSSGCAIFDRESGLVILQSLVRYVIVRAPSIQPRSWYR